MNTLQDSLTLVDRVWIVLALDAVQNLLFYSYSVEQDWLQHGASSSMVDQSSFGIVDVEDGVEEGTACRVM